MDNIIFLSVFFLLEFFPSFLLVFYPCYRFIQGSCWMTKMVLRLLVENIQYQLLVYLRTLAFIAGISFVFILLGYGAGFLGNLLYASWFQYVTGAVIILLGLHQMEVLHLKGLYKEKRLQLKRQGQKGKGYSQAFLLGLTFSFAWTPCVGPVLGSCFGLSGFRWLRCLAGSWSHVGLHAGFGATIFSSSSRLQLCLKHFRN